MNARNAVMVTESEPSTRLRVVAGYFTLTGTLSTFGLIYVVSLVLSGNSPELTAIASPHWWKLVPAVIAAVSQFWIAAALRNKRRSGWFAAVATVGVQLAIVATQRGSNWISIVSCIVGIAVLVSIRDETE